MRPQSREYSFNLGQGGLQIPAKYTFTGPPYIVVVLETNVTEACSRKENTVV